MDYLQDCVDKQSNPGEVLTDAEKKLISSIVGQLNWAARQGRYDLSYVASLVQELASGTCDLQSAQSGMPPGGPGADLRE